MISRARAAFNRGALLHEFIPCPEALLDERATICGGPNAAEYDQLRAENMEAHGYESWYDWRVANWGTKWDISGDVQEDGSDYLTVGFDSAWSPPLNAYWVLEDLGFEIEAYYFEPGMAFCGRWTNGVDESYNIPSTAAEANIILPNDINAMFGIVESMMEWEEDDVNAE
jgi:hypothetical protein